MLNKLKTIYQTLVYVTLVIQGLIIYYEYIGKIDFQGVGYAQQTSGDYLTSLEVQPVNLTYKGKAK